MNAVLFVFCVLCTYYNSFGMMKMVKCMAV